MSRRTREIPVDPLALRHEALVEAAAVLRRGGTVAFATETVYGLGADATNPDAVARIFEAKGRPAFNPLIVHAEGEEQARACVSAWPRPAELLARRFWPGPLTLVLPRASTIPDIVTAGHDTVGVRVPRHPVALGLIREADRPIAAPSANRSTGISPTQAQHVLKDLDGKIDMVLDSGPTGVGIESTVLDLTTDPPRVLRPGSVTVESLREALASEVLGPRPPTETPGAPTSPGQLAIHYAPRTPTFRVELERLAALARTSSLWALISFGPEAPTPGEFRPSIHVRLDTPIISEARLYGELHRLDALRLDLLVIVPPPDEPAWLALRDRIWRASQPWPGEG